MTHTPDPTTPEPPPPALSEQALDARLRAYADLEVGLARDGAGLRSHDGVLPDRSPEGVRAALARLGGPPRADAHDEAALAAAEDTARLHWGEREMHRTDPSVHLDALDVSCYDRPGADPQARAAARRAHLASWPDAVDAARSALDPARVPAAVAEALLPSAAGLTADLDPDEPHAAPALAAHDALMDHLRRCAREGTSEVALGSDLLARLYATPEATTVDLGHLACAAEDEIARLRALLADAVAAVRRDHDPTLPEALADAVAALQRDRPDAAGLLDEARALTREALDWVEAAGLVPPHEGTCEVGPAPPSKAHVTAMLEPVGPFAPDGPSRFLVTPPDADWDAEDVDAWLEIFNRTSLPAITVHEVAPGHFTHFRLLRQVTSPVRALVQSEAFIEGWAHEMEELLLEEGFRADDPRYAAGVALEALIRAVRLAASIGVHAGSMSVAEAEARFADDAFLRGSAARSEALRATFDPTYGRYTWGKLALRELRTQARRTWGAGYTHRRLHTALLALGAPPLGLLGRVLDDPRPRGSML